MRTAPGSSFASAYRNADPPPGAASWRPQTLAALRGQRRRTGERAWPRGDWMAHECHRYSSVTCPNRQSTAITYVRFAPQAVDQDVRLIALDATSGSCACL